MTVRIAVVGLGAAGACMVTALNCRFAESVDLQLSLYDACPPSELWRGRAFQRDGDAVLVNVPVEGMSVLPNDPSHARVWLENRGLISEGLRDDNGSFLPRSTYGDYLAHAAEQALAEMAARGWGVVRIEEDVTGIGRNGTTLRLTTRAGRRSSFDYVVLSLGGSVLASPWKNLDEGRLIENPYPTNQKLAQIPGSARVGILGSGLTAVDIAVALQAQGHQGPITMVSRTGILPGARMPGPSLVFRHLTQEGVMQRAQRAGHLTVHDAQRLLTLETRAIGGQPMSLVSNGFTTSCEDLRRQLIGPLTPEDLGVHVYQKSLASDLWSHIWYLLSERDKRLLLTPRRFRAVMSRCCPMPPANSRKILGLLDTGQLAVMTGTASRSGVAGSTPAVETERGTSRFDYLVNAITPARYGVPPAAIGLVDSAARQGLARNHFAGGLCVERNTSRVLAASGRANPRLYALGDLTRGSFFWINGIPLLLTKSVAISQAIYLDTSSPCSPASSGRVGETVQHE